MSPRHPEYWRGAGISVRVAVAEKRYELIVDGEAGPMIRAAFPGFEITERPPMTVIRGDISDPAALEETIARVLGLGLHLYEVRDVDERSDPPDQPPPR
jgi:hypothetical protein